jgi:hypothetical protein
MDSLDIGTDLQITKTGRQEAGTGTWISGQLNGHRFNALVFPARAESADFELGNSRISKLWLQRLADKTTVFNFDRGLDVAAINETAQRIVDFLTAGLAEHVYAG